MKKTFVRKISEKAEIDPSVILLTGDLGFGAFEEFAEKHPDNFLNVGIAEQSMASIAAGLALDGRRVFIYSLGNFPTLRCLEQLRNDICYNDLPITVVTNGGGMAYGYLGMSHHATEDISILRALPGMTVTAPADPMETERCFDYLYEKSSPGYLRLCRGGERVLHSTLDKFDKPCLLPLNICQKPDVMIIMTGEIASAYEKIAVSLNDNGVSANIFSSPIIKPAPDFSEIFQHDYKLVITVEENNYIGGLGGSVAEYLSQLASHPRLLRIGLNDEYYKVAGNHDFMKDHAGLSVEKIVGRIVEKYTEVTEL